MGEVYQATDTVLERSVAVKVLSDRYSRDPEARTRFRREALAAARLSGEPHVITVFDVGEHEVRPFIVMEYLEGGSLHTKLSPGRSTQTMLSTGSGRPPRPSTRPTGKASCTEMSSLPICYSTVAAAFRCSTSVSRRRPASTR